MKGPALALVLALSGCAAPSAGTATTPVTVPLKGAHIESGGICTVTVTITPTSEAKQEAKADAKVDATIPIK